MSPLSSLLTRWAAGKWVSGRASTWLVARARRVGYPQPQLPQEGPSWKSSSLRHADGAVVWVGRRASTKNSREFPPKAKPESKPQQTKGFPSRHVGTLPAKEPIGLPREVQLRGFNPEVDSCGADHDARLGLSAPFRKTGETPLSVLGEKPIFVLTLTPTKIRRLDRHWGLGGEGGQWHGSVSRGFSACHCSVCPPIPLVQFCSTPP